jgi:Spy/CpxP family protein refolding chaperone
MRIVKIAAVAVALLVGGAVLARGGHHRGGFFKRHVNAKIEGALDAAKASAEQRATIEKARDRVFSTIEASHASKQAHMGKVLQLFEADQIDPAQVKAVRAEYDAAAKANAEAILQALTETHQALQPAQRKAVVEYARANKPEGPPQAAVDWFKRRAFSHVKDALDEVKANDVQRAAVENALEQVWNAFKAEHDAGKGHIDEALKLFASDSVDAQAIAKLRSEHDARRQKISDAITQAFHDVHDTLTSAQRKQLVTWVRSHNRHM